MPSSASAVGAGSGPGPDAAARFAAELAALYRAADRPSYATLVGQAAAQRPPVRIRPQRLSDWLTGKAVPAEPRVVAFLVGWLQQQAGLPRRDLQWWRDLHQAARRQRQANRGGRPARAAPVADRAGDPIGECDPLALEVHPAVEVAGCDGGLPPYVLRAHDARLRKEALAGQSRLITLVGGSSTGKTRACWELARHLDQGMPDRWRLWHPYDPTRPEAVLAGLDRVGPHTVVWLNEAQLYLAPADASLGERIAAGLRALLREPGRGPVLILATLWPEYWAALTARPGNAQAVDLLTGPGAICVDVPERFTAEAVAEARRSGDPRWRDALQRGDPGRITQYFAGAPELLRRYRTAPPAARAVIELAIDARRLGHPPGLPHALFEQAGPGYLDDQEWDAQPDDWLDHALAYNAQGCRGTRGPLTRVRARPGQPAGPPVYRLADYLEQLGRLERSAVYPPASFWDSAGTAITDPGTVTKLAREASDRGRFRRAATLLRWAAGRGHAEAWAQLAELRERVGDRDGAVAAAREALKVGHTTGLIVLTDLLKRAGDRDGAIEGARAAAEYGDPTGLRLLAGLLDRDGAIAAMRAAVAAGHTDASALLVPLLEQAGDRDGAIAAACAAVDAGHIYKLSELAEMRLRDGDRDGAVAVDREAANRGCPDALWLSTRLREEAGDHDGAMAAAREAADRGDPGVLGRLTDMRTQLGDPAGAIAAARAAAGYGHTDSQRRLAWLLEQSGDLDGAVVAARAAVDGGHDESTPLLVGLLLRSGDSEAAIAAIRAAVDRSDPDWRWRWIEWLQRAGDHDGAEALFREAASLGSRVLVDLAELREGDDAVALYRQAASMGSTQALCKLAELRGHAGDHEGAATLYREAADCGDTGALMKLADLRAQAGDLGSAAAACREVADLGYTQALGALIELRTRTGDHDGAAAAVREVIDRGDAITFTQLQWGMLEVRPDAIPAGMKFGGHGLNDDGMPAEAIE
ncbi:tetratricopeptide repeat protein [Paractinoplanes rishiriensis]|uniref:tetratricopeptide repeat protein n=1 Tax=Paractinoplanes rishiriensis TaxID=1050105 RepID=UPI001945096F|nr:tetratricopeptide repeat protein [Actinoplanes rishiriensis]